MANLLRRARFIQWTSQPKIAAVSTARLLSSQPRKFQLFNKQVPLCWKPIQKSPVFVQQCRDMSANPGDFGEVKDRVMHCLHCFDKIDKDKLELGSHFMKDLGLDSLDHVEIIMAIEDEFAHHIPDSDAEKLLTPQELIDYMGDKYDLFQ